MGNLNPSLFFYSYFKLFKFTFLFYLRRSILKLDFLVFYSYLKLIKFLFSIQAFSGFVPDWFSIRNPILISFWVNGFVTNYAFNKWFVLGTKAPRILPCVLLNLTDNLLVTREIKTKNNPTVDFLFSSSPFYFDYFLKSSPGLLLEDFFDTLCYFIVLLSYVFRLKVDV